MKKSTLNKSEFQYLMIYEALEKQINRICYSAGKLLSYVEIFVTFPFFTLKAYDGIAHAAGSWSGGVLRHDVIIDERG